MFFGIFVLNRVGKSAIFVLNRVWVWGAGLHLPPKDISSTPPAGVWISSDCFESFSPLSNIVTGGVITTSRNRMKFRLHWGGNTERWDGQTRRYKTNCSCRCELSCLIITAAFKAMDAGSFFPEKRLIIEPINLIINRLKIQVDYQSPSCESVLNLPKGGE